MPIIYLFGKFKVMPNEPFYTSDTLHLKSNTFLKDTNIKDLGKYVLSDRDKAEIQKLIPNFQLHQLHKFMFVDASVQNRWKDEIFFYPQTAYKKFGQPEYDVSLMITRPDKKAFKYKDYLNSDRDIFKKPHFRKIPNTLAAAELLFDEDVLEIKELVTKTQKIIKEENYPDAQRNFILYDNSDIVQRTFFTELKKILQPMVCFQLAIGKKILIL